MSLWPVLGSAVPTRTGNRIALAAGSRYQLGPGAGVYMVQLDSLGYLALLQRDPIARQEYGVSWASASAMQLVYSDGINYSIRNQTGIPLTVASLTAGTGYTSAPTVTPSAGNSTWTAFVGGAVSITLGSGGFSYTYPPIILIDAPPAPGVQATAYCAITSGAVSSITIQAAGAGYINPPNITFLNDPRDTTGYGATGSVSLSGAGTVTGLLLRNPGVSVGSTPTLAFSGGGGSGAAATVTAITAAAAATAYIQQM